MIISRIISVTHGVSGSGEGMRAIKHEQATAGRNASDLPIWIPCSEQLPKDASTVLLTDRFRTVRFGYVDFDGNWYLGDAETKVDPGEVIAWMPLPRPWRGAETTGGEQDEN